MSTNLNTLKARARKLVRHNTIADDGEMPDTLKHADASGNYWWFLVEGLIIEMAELMQKHEEWVEGGKIGENPYV